MKTYLPGFVLTLIVAFIGCGQSNSFIQTEAKPRSAAQTGLIKVY